VAREILVEQLGHAGARADSAGGAREALERLRAAAAGGDFYACILVDTGLPEVGGVGLTRSLRSDAELAELPVVLLTSSSSERMAAAGAVVVRKPVREARLCAAVASALRGVPLADAEDAPPAEAREARANGERPIVLVAEDNAINSALTVRLLETYGYEADVAWNGREAIEATTRRRYDAVLMDCQMPTMDGYAATEEIRRNELPGEHIPILAMTAHSMKGDRERCIAAGMDDYLSKPIRPADLAETLARWVESAPSQ
jgi:two-component system sensor histidine kinase/response regulator